MNLIGISGTNGSGKDSLGKFLADDYGYLDVSVSEFLRQEAQKRGLPIEREVLRNISAEWRRDYGVGVLVDKAVELFNQSGNKYTGLVAIPMRNPGEAQHIKDLGGKLVWVDADPKLRYDRIYSRQRSAEDNKTFEQFQREEYEEMHHHGGDEATLNMAAVKAMADIFITNDNNNFEDFKTAAKKALNL
ncbi:MAG TPA: AAA family ATPase [Candidatus Babeliales bacterium]|nr:AAA family ATPase [Candidatus Babeliales bacterium]